MSCANPDCHMGRLAVDDNLIGKPCPECQVSGGRPADVLMTTTPPTLTMSSELAKLYMEAVQRGDVPAHGAVIAVPCEPGPTTIADRPALAADHLPECMAGEPDDLVGRAIAAIDKLIGLKLREDMPITAPDLVRVRRILTGGDK